MSLNDLNSNDINNSINKSETSSKPFISSFINELKKHFEKSQTPTFYTIDRIEGDFAVCENRETLKMSNIPLSNLPTDISSNIILKFENNSYSIDYEKTQKLKKSLKEKQKNIWQQ